MRRCLPLALLLLVTACSKDANERATPSENDLAAKASADVDAAMAEARHAAALPAPAAAAATEADGETAAIADGR